MVELQGYLLHLKNMMNVMYLNWSLDEGLPRSCVCVCAYVENVQKHTIRYIAIATATAKAST